MLTRCFTITCNLLALVHVVVRHFDPMTCMICINSEIANDIPAKPGRTTCSDGESDVQPEDVDRVTVRNFVVDIHTCDYRAITYIYKLRYWNTRGREICRMARASWIRVV